MRGICRWFPAYLCLGAVFLGCSRPLPEGMGSNHEIVVIADSLERELFEKQLRYIFEKQVRTPQIERVFTLEFQKPKDFDFYRQWKNLLLLSPLHSQGQAAQLIKSLLTSRALNMVENDSAYMFVKKDVWAKEQVLLLLTAKDNQTLNRKLQVHASEIFELMERCLDQKIEAWLYAKGWQQRVEKQLWERFGWSIRLPTGYRIERQSADSSFVWIRKRNPDRWLFVHWESLQKGAKVSETTEKEFWARRRNQICQLCYHGDRVVLPLTEVSRTTFGAREAVRLDGLWENREKLAGGPFRTWFFADSPSARSFMVDIALCAPAFDKEPYLRHLEIIAHTFSTEEPNPAR